MTARLLIAFLICCSSVNLIGSPASDLSSSSQEVRDAAAKALRSSNTLLSRTNWEAIAGAMTNGMARMSVTELLSPHHTIPSAEGGPDGSYRLSYRLDDTWILICHFRYTDDALLDRTLSASPLYVWVEPPTNFTGVWITYYVNGQKSHEVHYDNGKYQGEFIFYSPDGSKSTVQQFNHHLAEGANTEYYPSGRLRFRGVCKAGAPIGTWIYYNEDGTTNSATTFSKQ